MKIINRLTLFSREVLFKSFSDYRVVIKYIVSGLIGIFINLLVLYVLTDIANFWYVVSAVLAFIISFVITFVLQKFWTFNDYVHSRTSRQIILYLMISLLNLVLNVLILYILVDLLNFWYLGSQAVTLLFLSGFIFLLNRNITFRNSSKGSKIGPEI